MKLRMLEQKDAPFMLEWMHDDDVVKDLFANFKEKTIDDCKNFIAYSQKSETDLNLAIVGDDDEYLGTVSLKHIDKEEKTAEFAITVRKKTMGTGASAFGMKAILEKGINELGLDKIFWCVNEINARAVRFYDKNGYQRTDLVPTKILSAYPDELLKGFIWYVYGDDAK